MLTVDASKRITAAEALEHPWIKAPAVDLPEENLDGTIKQLKLFNARTKLRAAINSVVRHCCNNNNYSL
jgi:serine/threonine protein kinase